MTNHSANERRFLRLSLAHLTLLDATPLELIDAAAAGGFDYIGLRIVPPTPADPIVPVVGDQDLIRRIERRLDETGIRIRDVETFWLSPYTRVEDLVPALETAARLGAHGLLVVGNDPDESRLVSTFAKLCEAAHPYGLKVMLEFIPFCQTRTLEAALGVLTQATQPNARLLVDALHVIRSGGSPDSLRGVDPALLEYWQICDASAGRPSDGDLRTEARTRRFYPGQGELPLAAPFFLNFIRSACQTVVTTGRGIGGALLTARVDFTDGGRHVFAARGAEIAERICALDGVTGVHVGVADPSVTSYKTAETELKKLAGEAVFDGVVLVEGIGRHELEAVVPRVEELLTHSSGVARTENAVYDLAYLLTSEETA